MTQTIDEPTKHIERSRQRAHDESPVDLAQLMGFDPALVKQMNEIESAVAKCETVMSNATGNIAKAFAMAHGIGLLRKLITDQLVNQHIMPLMNTRLGFKTDRDPKRAIKDRKTGEWKNPEPYSTAVVKECLIESLIRGARPINNEFNIISAGPYLTKEYFIRSLGELPGVTDIVASPGIPRIDAGKTVVRFGLSWKKDGRKDMLRSADESPGRIFEIKSDDYSSTDQILGKATRKAYAAAYQQITGSEITLPEGDADESPANPTPEPSQAKDRGRNLKDRLTASQAEAAPESTPPVSPPASKGDVTTQPEDAGGGEPPIDEDSASVVDIDATLAKPWPQVIEFLWATAEKGAFVPERESFDKWLQLKVKVGAGKLGKESEIKLSHKQAWYREIMDGKAFK